MIHKRLQCLKQSKVKHKTKENKKRHLLKHHGITGIYFCEQLAWSHFKKKNSSFFNCGARIFDIRWNLVYFLHTFQDKSHMLVSM